jgi:hypothetical protein
LCGLLRRAAEDAEACGDMAALLHGNDGTVGIINRNSVTCYAAAPLQALSALWPLTRLFLNGAWASQLNLEGRDGSKGAAVAIAYAATIQELWRRKPAAAASEGFYPTALYAAMKERFKTVAPSGKQHDAHGAWVGVAVRELIRGARCGDGGGPRCGAGTVVAHAALRGRWWPTLRCGDGGGPRCAAGTVVAHAALRGRWWPTLPHSPLLHLLTSCT